MTRDDFEHKVLALWIESRIPMTTANIQYYTKLPRKRVEQWLESLASEGTLDMILTQDGQVLWKVMGGAQRPLNGATTFEELSKSGHSPSPPPEPKSNPLLEQFNAVKAASSTALVLSDAKNQLTRPRQDGEKSYLWSMGLSLFGPLGWLYAGAWREAIPASAVFLFSYWILNKILPFFLFGPILLILLPASAIVGGIYAYKYNKHGKRQALLPEKK